MGLDTGSYRSVIQTMPQGVVSFSLEVTSKNQIEDAVLLECNEAFREMLDLQTEDLSGMRLSAVLLELFQYNSQYRYIILDGVSRGDHVTFEEYVPSLGAWYSITAYSHARGYCTLLFQKIKGLAADYRDIVETQGNMICRFLPDATIVYANAAFLEFFQLQEEDLGVKRFLELMPEDEQTWIQANISYLCSIQEPLFYEHKMEVGQEVYWLQWTIHPRPEGRGAGFLCIGHDKTREKRQQEKLEAIIQACQDISFVITEPTPDGTDSVIKDFSPGAETIFGYTKEEVLETSVGRLHCQEDVQQFKAIHEGLENNEIWRGTMTLIRKNGESFPALFTVYPFKTEKGTPATLGVSMDLTELQRAEEQNRLLGTVVSNSSDSVVVMDLSQIITYMNEKGEELFGYTLEEMEGQPVAHLFTETETQHIRNHLETTGAREASGETLIRNREGRDFICEYKIMALEDSHGEPSAYVLIQSDITQRRQVEEALRESEERLRTIFQAAENVAIIVTDTHPHHPHVLEFNPGAENIFGYTKEEILGQSVEILHTPEDVQKFPEQLNIMVQKKRGISSESTMIRKSGEAFPALFTSYPLLNEEGIMWGALGVSIDITEIKEAEAALRESEERFRQMADNIDEVFWLRSSDNQELLYINKAYEIIWGRPREQLYKEPEAFLGAVHPEDKHKVLEEYDRYARGNLFDLEYRVVQPEGAIRWVWARSFPVRDAEGTIIRHTGIAVDITARKEAEKALEENQEYLRGILESQLDLVVRVDQEGRFVYVNEAYCRAFGKKRQDLIGQTFLPLIHPDDQESTKKAMEHLYVPPYRAYMEQRAKTVHGWRWLAWQDYAIRDSKGEIIEIQGVGRDITEQKEAEAELQAQAQKYQTILETTGEGFCLLDIEGNFLEVNSAYCAMLGYERQDLLHLSIQEVQIEREPGEREEYLQSIREKGSHRFETRHRHAKGLAIDLEVSATYLRAHQGRYVVFLRDITHRKQAEKQLKEKEERFRRIFHEGPLGMVLMDQEHTFFLVNDEICHMLDYSREELLTMNTDHIVFHEDRGIYKELIQELKGQEVNSAQREFRVLTGLGEILWINAIQTIIADAEGKPAYYLAMMEDISQRMDMVNQLAEYTARTEVANVELEKARDLALEASRAKSDFLSVISHEIRTPLNSILGMADLLAETPLNPEQGEYVEMFRNAGETLLRLINDILDLSKVESSRFELQEERLAVGDLIQRVTDLMRMKANEKGLNLTYSIAQDVPPYVLGDGGRLRQILINLLGNAVKFTHEGEILVKVKRQDIGSDENTTRLLFSVQDTGIGISPEKQEAIFEHFSQVDSTMTRNYEGTGLGLAISRRLVERLGGTLEVDSTPDVGSTFYFTVVFTPVEKEEEVEDKNRDLLQKPETGEEKPLSILLVEDNMDNRLLIGAFLKHSPHTLSLARNGEEAVHMVEEGEYDLVLMDIQMPIMDGYTATQEIRQREKEQGKKPLHILALTAHAMKEEIQKALDAGCDAHLSKPVKKQTLLHAIEVVGRKRH